MTHTPAPWHLHDMEAGIICTEGGLSIINCNAPMLSGGEVIANAKFIVEACNNYAALKKSHAELLSRLQILVEHALENNPCFTSERGLTEIKKAQEAIFAAESLGVKS